MTAKTNDITGSGLYHKEEIQCKQCGHSGTDYSVADKSGQYIARCSKCGAYLKNVPHIDKYFTKEQRAEIFSKTNGCCCYCGKALNPFKEMDVEHVDPRNNGGSNAIENLYMSCPSCNRRKQDKTLEQYRMWLKEQTCAEKIVFHFEYIEHGPRHIREFLKNYRL